MFKFFKSPILLPLFFLIILLLSGFSLYRVVAGKSLLPFSRTYKVGAIYFAGERRVGVSQPFTVKLKVDSSGQFVNAAGVQLRFDPARLQVMEMNTLESFCQYYPDKKYDNKMGVISLSCGSPHPGSKNPNTLLEVKFTPLTIGNTVIYMSDTSKLLLSNGKGTNILHDFPQWEVQVVSRL
jgi:hypothetical protein